LADHPFQFGNGPFARRQVDDRARKNPAFVVERPGLGEPLVEGVHHGEGELAVVHQVDLQDAGQGGEKQRRVDSETVENIEASVGIGERRYRAHGVAGYLAQRAPVGVVARDVVTERSGAGHHLERRIRDVVADHPPQRDLGPPFDPHVANAAGVFSGQMP
jgi:hypothetical protein